MVDKIGISGKEKKLEPQLKAALNDLEKAKKIGSAPAIREAEIRIEKLKKLGQKPSIGESKRGDPTGATSLKGIVKSEKSSKDKATKQSPIDIWNWKNKPDKDWTKDYSKMWEKTGDAEEDAWLDDPGLGYNHGGRIKKPKKKVKEPKRAALRGERSESIRYRR